MRVLYPSGPRQLHTASRPRAPRRFHRALGGDARTPLLAQPELAARWGVGQVHVKVETSRLGLPSFKIMGASWAVIEALRPVLPSWWRPEYGLAPLAGALPEVTLLTATEGNHGHALARIARLIGLRARVLIPESAAEHRVDAILAEGAEVVCVPGTYDDAVSQSAVEAARKDHVLVSDTSWPGYERVPAAVIDGYSTILWEIDEQLAEAGCGAPDLVLVQVGVGSFAAAVIRHFRAATGGPRIVGVEPAQAACVMASLAADRLVTIPGPHKSMMTGLNCGSPSYVAWPTLSRGLDAAVAIEDDLAMTGTRTMADQGVAVGPCSGAGVGAAGELLAGEHAGVHRRLLGIGPDSTVLLFATEGAHDPVPASAARSN
ncbi:diaminopropionate ammonia-lyase [Thermoactinospora rubra]|uniref:diaminopropionate ammonia-lyase n=1 Tax=Thermoactinospora rubra TaxID=1088767 RepID=UPI001302035C|nr:diaminopropionate ammonia-lyase [Thermoactinospora rubra]